MTTTAPPAASPAVEAIQRAAWAVAEAQTDFRRALEGAPQDLGLHPDLLTVAAGLEEDITELTANHKELLRRLHHARLATLATQRAQAEQAETALARATARAQTAYNAARREVRDCPGLPHLGAVAEEAKIHYMDLVAQLDTARERVDDAVRAARLAGA